MAGLDAKLVRKVFLQGCTIWGIAAIFYFFDNLLNVSPGAMKSELSIAFKLSGAELGMLSSSYLWAYGLMQIPVGLLMDKVGPRRLFTIAGLLCAIGSAAFAAAQVVEVAQLGRVLIGIGASFAVVGCSKIASVWFTARRFALFMGLMVSIGMLGGAFGLATVNLIVTNLGWRTASYWGAAIALLLSLLLWVVVRDKPPIKLHTEVTVKQVKVWRGLLEVTSSGQVWIASIYAGLMFVPTLAFGALWGTPFLVEGHSLSQQLSGVLVSLIFIGWVFGGPIYGWISDFLGLRNAPMYVANIATLLISLLIIYVANLSFVAIGSLMFLLGFFSSGFILAFAVTREKNRHEISGTAIGFINTINTFSVAAFQWLIGKVLDVTATGVVINEFGEKLFSYHDYQNALLTIPACLTVAFVSLLFLKETYCKVREDD